MLKKIVTICLSLLMIISICACGFNKKSEAAQALDEKIQSIETVTLESGALLSEIESDYLKLTDKEKAQLEYYQSYEAAKESYEKLVDKKKAEEEAKKAEEEAKNNLIKEIEDLIKDNKSAEALEKIELIEDETKKSELQKEFKDKCYDKSEYLFKFGNVVSTKPAKTDEKGRKENYYYFYSQWDIENAFDQYNKYLSENFEFSESSNSLGVRYRYRSGHDIIELYMFTVDVDGVWLLQVKY